MAPPAGPAVTAIPSYFPLGSEVVTQCSGEQLGDLTRLVDAFRADRCSRHRFRFPTRVTDGCTDAKEGLEQDEQGGCADEGGAD